VLSGLFHLSAIVLIIAAIDDRPEGAASFDSGEIGIVLGDSPNESGGSKETAAAPQAVAPPLLADVAPAAEPATAAPVSAPSVASPRIAQAKPSASGSGTGYGPGDGQASVRVFGVEGKGSRFVYVFDRSSSMEGAPLANAKQQLIQSLDSLSRVHQFHVIFFNQRVQHFDLSGGGKRVAFATDRNKKFAERFVGGISADGGTDRYPALRTAMQMHPDVIFFLTDAEDDPMPVSELREIVELNQRTGVTISTIEFGRGPAKQSKNFLTELARITGGQYGYVDVTQLSP
jgi:hypothetical protein